MCVCVLLPPQRSPRVMYFSSDQGESFSRALLPSASTEQVRHTNTLQKKIPKTKLEYVHKPEFMIFNFRIVGIGLLQELLLSHTFLVCWLVLNSCYLRLFHTSET